MLKFPKFNNRKNVHEKDVFQKLDTETIFESRAYTKSTLTYLLKQYDRNEDLTMKLNKQDQMRQDVTENKYLISLNKYQMGVWHQKIRHREHQSSYPSLIQRYRSIYQIAIFLTNSYLDGPTGLFFH